MFCVGLNYWQYVVEMMMYNKFNQDQCYFGESDELFFVCNLVEVDCCVCEGMLFFWMGFYFLLVGVNDNVILLLVGEYYDWEFEFGVIIFGIVCCVVFEEVEVLIVGYVMVNDFGMVDEFCCVDVWWGYDWVSKYQFGFKLFGLFMVFKEFVDCL